MILAILTLKKYNMYLPELVYIQNFFYFAHILYLVELFPLLWSLFYSKFLQHLGKWLVLTFHTMVDGQLFLQQIVIQP